MSEPDVLDAYEALEGADPNESGSFGNGSGAEPGAAPPNIATDEELREVVDGAIELFGWGFPEPVIKDWKRRHGDSLMRMSRRFRVDEIVAGKSTQRLMPNRPAWQVALLGGVFLGFVLYRQREGYVEFMTQQAQEAQSAQANPGGDSEGVASDSGRAGAGAAGD